MGRENGRGEELLLFSIKSTRKGLSNKVGFEQGNQEGGMKTDREKMVSSREK